jgi:hypothetical protein
LRQESEEQGQETGRERSSDVHHVVIDTTLVVRLNIRFLRIRHDQF